MSAERSSLSALLLSACASSLSASARVRRRWDCLLADSPGCMAVLPAGCPALVSDLGTRIFSPTHHNGARLTIDRRCRGRAGSGRLDASLAISLSLDSTLGLIMANGRSLQLGIPRIFRWRLIVVAGDPI
jgi:hypothetical protein